MKALALLASAAAVGRADPETTASVSEKYKEACVATVGSIFN